MRSNSDNKQRILDLQQKNVIHFLWLNTEFFQNLKEMSLSYDLQNLNPFSLLFTRLKFAEDEALFKEFKLALADLASEKLNYMDKMDTLLSKHSHLTEVMSFFLTQNPPALLDKYLEKFYSNDTLVDKDTIMKRNERLKKYQEIVEKKINASDACKFLISYAEFFHACIQSSQSFIDWVCSTESRQKRITAFSNELKNLLCDCPATETYKLRPFLVAVDQLLTKPELMRNFLTLNNEVVNFILCGGGAILAYIYIWYADHPEANLKKQNRQTKEEAAVENIENNNKMSSVVVLHTTHFQPNKSPREENLNPDDTLKRSLSM